MADDVPLKSHFEKKKPQCNINNEKRKNCFPNENVNFVRKGR